MSDTEVSVVMPCLNEAETIGQCIDKANQFFKENNVIGEVVIGDNGSTDGSIDIAKEKGARVIHVKEKGYGSACAGGIREARGKYIIMGDSDMSYDFYNLMPFVDKLRQGYDLVMGNRFKGGIMPGAMPFKNRYIGNPVLSLVGRILFSSEIGDFHCGLRGFSKKAYERMNIQSMGMEFASELVFKSQMMNMKISEVPTVLSKDGRSRPPHLRPWRDGLRHLRLMLLFSPNYLFLVPGITMITIGLLMMLFIVSQGSLSIGKVSLSATSLVYAAMFFIAGIQTFLFGYLAKYYGIREGVLVFNEKTYNLFQRKHIDILLLIGIILVIVGIIGGIYSLVYWSSKDFGALNTMDILSISVPTVVSFMTGLELVLFALLVGVFHLKKDKNETES